MAHKGKREDRLVEQVIEDLETDGLRNDRIVLKSDQENSITEVMREVQKRRQADFGTAIDTSRVGDSDSNGTVEAAVQSFQGMARTLRFALEEKLKQKLTLSDPIMVGLVRHAGHLLTRCAVKANGRTAYQMIKGRRSNVKLVAFGETVLFHIPTTRDMPGKFEERWEQGVYVGFVIRSGENLVATSEGVFKVSAIRRRPLEERWSKDLLDKIAAASWTTSTTTAATVGSEDTTQQTW